MTDIPSPETLDGEIKLIRRFIAEGSKHFIPGYWRLAARDFEFAIRHLTELHDAAKREADAESESEAEEERQMQAQSRRARNDPEHQRKIDAYLSGDTVRDG